MKVINMLVALSIGMVSLSSNAMGNQSEKQPLTRHSVGISLAAGGAEYKGSSADGDGVSHFYAYYNYQFNDSIAWEVGAIGGADLDDWKCNEIEDNRWECLSDSKPIFNLDANELYYSSLVFAAKGKLQLSRRNSLYGKIGGQFYDYEFERNNTNLVSEDGVGLFLEAGWQLKWDSGWGINASFQYMDMGDLEVSSFGTGLSYSFN